MANGVPVVLRPQGCPSVRDLPWGQPFAPVTVAREEFYAAQEALLRPGAIDDAVWGLKRRQPEDSAFWVVTRPQMRAGFAVVLGLVLATLLWPLLVATVVIVILSAVNFAIAAFRFVLALAAPEPDPSDQGIADTGLEHWPHYTVMIPMFREAAVAPRLVAAIGRMDYPPERLEVFLVCEADDTPTVAAARLAVSQDPRFRVICVPPCEPRTKPKALNYALRFATGDLTVIYDAEDRPDRDQLKKAAIAFARGPASLACVQARLNWYNRGQNWLTRAFALEYALWFDYLLPGLERLGAPIPLGGTSNHFKTEALIRCGGWDPFNVTEDADLGLRLMRLGGSVATLDSTTLEEATCTSRAWIRQRSRWIKGYMQTWLVQMRDPARLWRVSGPVGFLGFQLFVGGVALTALVNPILWLLSAATLVAWALGVEFGLAWGGEVWTILSLAIGNAGLIYLNMLAVLRRRWFDLIPAALGTPVYWVLISLAGYKAVGQLITNPFYWEKTEHGVGASS